MQKQPFGTADGLPVDLYTLANKNGVVARIANFGGVVVSLDVPDRKGKLGDVVLGYDTLVSYLKDKDYLGAIVGRYANRIARGNFTLNGIAYVLAKNNGGNHLHGGVRSFNKRVWVAKDVSNREEQALELTYLSKDGEEGYPGNLAVTLIYTLNNKNELKIDYAANTDKDTVINLTNHSYFNLAGQSGGDILNHQLIIRGDRFVPVDATLIPTGTLRSVKGTPFDFTEATAIGALINQDDRQLKFGNGYDHTWVLQERTKGGLHPAAQAYDPKSGRRLEVLTTEPGIQFYTGNFLGGSIGGKSGQIYTRRYGFCLEPQHFPDSPNHPSFPSTVLKAGQLYHSTTVYRFSVGSR